MLRGRSFTVWGQDVTTCGHCVTRSEKIKRGHCKRGL